MTNIAIVYYSATGNIAAMANAIGEGAASVGAEVRVRRVAETAPAEAIASNPKWQAHFDEMANEPLATLDDLEWADGIALGSPTRFGGPASQLKSFLDTTGGLWFKGALVNTVGTAFTTASTAHGGLESTTLAINNHFYHWGSLIMPLGYGAEVIKIEDPKRGDPLRDWGQEKAHGKSLWWPIAARNKKCVTADLRTPEGQQIVKELVEQSDMLLENFRPGTLERWGLGYDVLSKINPGLILIRVSGYGQTGPYAPRPGYASVGEAMGGLRYVIGEPDRMPARAGISLGDSLAATFATLGALAALHSKEKTGKGQVIDASIYESVMAYMESLIPEWAIGGYQRERTGSVLPKITPSNVYPTKSGEMLLIAANMDTVFKRLAHAMGKPELADDPKYATHIARGENTEELDAMIGDWSRTWEMKDLINHLIEEEVPHGLVYTAKDMIADPHIQARESIINVDVPGVGEFPMQNIFPFFSDTKPSIRWSGPAHGEHTDEVYGDLLGYDATKLAELRTKGIIK